MESRSAESLQGQEPHFCGPSPAVTGRCALHGVDRGGRGQAGGPTGVKRADEPARRLAAIHQATMLRMLVQLREDAGFNQTRLASSLRITQSEVSKFERGERVLDVLRLRAWLRALGIDLASFALALDDELNRLERWVD